MKTSSLISTSLSASASPKRKKKDEVAGKIKWSGDIPPRKWTTFYTKVIAKFASAHGFTVRVSFEAPAQDQAAAKINELKSSLRDLGLDENIEA